MINKRFFKTKDEVEVTFEFPQESVSSSVALVADFLDWQPTLMKKVAKTKSFKFKTRLPKDQQFEFRYLVDNERWINDPSADQYKANGFGEDNGLVNTY
ncbi:isoamylase early set domain-containing protein [Vibrio sp. 404]|uniref:Isoamylase early set domain-containing protein n=1 Tax=Vibrio marinisediminis TaxID=2758441 RepID=A0A7W2ISF6_9VIBR|nr:isoamylase early set domain-containing protein [Vibrio marinisediminis]MBA5761451.1 isoamylase early set domain-containing protein [Vibrio marinisediminis]